MAFDDVTELVSAQRMAAWGDVARRIAHEIKNPLTPIQLSAERIKRKFRNQVSDPEELEQYTDVIVRQTNDLRRIVDEFSKFARMPEPDRRETDLTALVKAAVMLQENGQPDVKFVKQFPAQPDLIELDATMIGQALTNLIKNAGEAIEEVREKHIPVWLLPRDPGHAHTRRDPFDHHHRRQRRRPAARPLAAVRALCDDARKGHGPGPAHRQEDHRGTWRDADPDGRARL